MIRGIAALAHALFDTGIKLIATVIAQWEHGLKRCSSSAWLCSCRSGYEVLWT